MAWSIEKELIKLSKKNSLKAALPVLFGTDFDEIPHIEKITDWYRSGSETYAFSFTIEQKHMFLKACCPSSPTISIDSILRSWIERRKIFERSGVPTPRLYGYGDGLVLEEFIPYHLEAVNPTQAGVENMMSAIQKISDVLINNNFSPVNPFGNLMSRGDDVVWVDFGQDLGNPEQENTDVQSISDAAITLMQNLSIRAKKS